MAKSKDLPAEPAPFTPPAGGGRFQLINGVPVPVAEDEVTDPEPSGD